jgi:hypothetical protein
MKTNYDAAAKLFAQQLLVRAPENEYVHPVMAIFSRRDLLGV